MEDKKKWFQKKENWWISIGAVLAVLAVCIPFYIMNVSKSPFELGAFQNLGAVGDFFGGTTVGLLSLASITLVTAAIVMQKEELRLQRNELKLTREEFKTGNDTAKVQQIDNAFFNMLSLHHEIVNNIRVTIHGETYTGRGVFTVLKKKYENNFAFYRYQQEDDDGGRKKWLSLPAMREIYHEKVFNNHSDINQEDLNIIYEDFHNDYGNNIGHYMRNNYRIVKFIVNNIAESEEEKGEIMNITGREPIIGDKRYYFGMLRAQWSNDEFELILINSLYSKHIKFKNLIIEHDVLDIKDSASPKGKFILKDSMDKFIAYRKLIEIDN